MNSLKISVFTLVLGLSMGAMAADNTNGTTRSDRNTDSRDTSDSMRMQDCSSKSGADKMLCEKDMQHDKFDAMDNDSRANQEGNMNDMHKKNKHSKELKSNGNRIKDSDSMNRNSSNSNNNATTGSNRSNGSGTINGTTGNRSTGTNSSDTGATGTNSTGSGAAVNGTSNSY